MKVSEFQFVNPYLKEISFEESSDFVAKDKEIEIENKFDVQINKSETETMANVELILETNMNMENAPFKMRISVASDFKWGELDEKKVDTMLKINAPALLLSYMRPIVSNITNVSRFPVYNLPFVNFKE